MSTSLLTLAKATEKPFAEKQDFRGRTILVMAIEGNYRKFLKRLLMVRMFATVRLIKKEAT